MRTGTMLFVALAICVGMSSVALAVDPHVDAAVSMTATVDSFAEWDTTEGYNVIAAGEWDAAATIGAVGTDLTVTKGLTLYANATVTLSLTAGGNDGILKNTVGADTLTTTYGIKGAGVDEADRDAAASMAADAVADPLGFFAATNTYGVTHATTVGSYAIDLMVKATSADARAQDAGSYTAGLTVIATWPE